MTRAFRFSAPMPRLGQSPSRWRDEVRRIEDLGFSSLSVSDHFTRGWKMEPVVVMTAAAEATMSLRVLSLVFGNDYRHPIILHKSMATLDVLSEGRVEIGLGAGWMLDDYRAANLPFDPAPERVQRLEEAAVVLKGLFDQDPFTFRGKHYQVEDLDGLPKPVQRPHPPLLVGGGGKRVLEVAARVADIIGINPSQRAGAVTSFEALDQTVHRVGEKVAWVDEVLREAGRSIDDVELQIRLLSSHVSRSSDQARTMLTALAERMAVSPAILEHSPALLYGTVEQCVEALEERRERFGISYVNLTSENVEDVAPIVARLAGT
jgi:probable F420-dependent oxidoreductase